MTGALGTTVGTFTSAVADGVGNTAFDFTSDNSMSTEGGKVFAFNDVTTETIYGGKYDTLANSIVVKDRLNIGELDRVDISAVKDFGLGVKVQKTVTEFGSRYPAIALYSEIENNGLLQIPTGIHMEAKTTGTGGLGQVYGINALATHGGSSVASLLAGIAVSVGTVSGTAATIGANSFNGVLIGTPQMSGTATSSDVQGLRIRKQGSTKITTATGIWLEPQTDSATNQGIVLAGDNAGNDIIFGAGQDASIFYDGTDLVVDPRLVGSGNLKILGGGDLIHTATETDDHAFEIDCDAAGFGDVKAFDIDYITGAIGATDDNAIVLLNVDESGSTGGVIYALEVLTTDEGSAEVYAVKTGIQVNPISHDSGTFGNMDSLLVKAVDQLAALSAGGAGNISVFVADNDTITIGDAAKFEELEIIVDTGASGAGIAPTFEYSTGVGTWATFSPSDGTNGFRNIGAVLWDDAQLSGWAVGTGTEFLIRITRTRNSLTTTPILDEVQISAATIYSWDKNGDVIVNSVTAATTSTARCHISDYIELGTPTSQDLNAGNTGTGSEYDIVWDVAASHIDTATFTHDEATNGERITVDVTGRYEVLACVMYDQNTGSTRINQWTFVKKNGTTNLDAFVGSSYHRGNAWATLGTSSILKTEVDLVAGDYITIRSKIDFTGSTTSNIPTVSANTSVIIRRIG